MSLTQCCLLGKSQLLISPLSYLTKVHSDDAIEAIGSTAVPTHCSQYEIGPTYVPRQSFHRYPHADALIATGTLLVQPTFEL